MVPPISGTGGAAPYAGMPEPNDSTDVVVQARPRCCS
jgi:hypothetical protein